MIIKQLYELHPWNKNARAITRESLERLKKQLTELGQYKPLLITSDGTIIAGNMRYRGMIEIGISQAKCMLLEFQKEEEGFIAIIDGEPQRTKFYQTIEDAMMEYSLSDNDRAGYYDAEELMRVMPEFNINYNDYSVDLFKPMNIPVAMSKLVAPDLVDQGKSYNVIIEATSEEERKLLADKLKNEGYKVKDRKRK